MNFLFHISTDAIAPQYLFEFLFSLPPYATFTCSPVYTRVASNIHRNCSRSIAGGTAGSRAGSDRGAQRIARLGPTRRSCADLALRFLFFIAYRPRFTSPLSPLLFFYFLFMQLFLRYLLSLAYLLARDPFLFSFCFSSTPRKVFLLLTGPKLWGKG